VRHPSARPDTSEPSDRSPLFWSDEAFQYSLPEKLPRMPTIPVLVSVRPEWCACNRLCHAFHHHLTTNWRHQTTDKTQLTRRFKTGRIHTIHTPHP
jgi:hypothetical protein